MAAKLFFAIVKDFFLNRFKPSQVTPNLIGMRWEKPDDAITHYTLRVVNSTGYEVVDNQRIEGDQNEFVVRSLKPGTYTCIYILIMVSFLFL